LWDKKINFLALPYFYSSHALVVTLDRIVYFTIQGEYYEIKQFAFFDYRLSDHSCVTAVAGLTGVWGIFWSE
jgi:hypothetical protein